MTHSLKRRLGLNLAAGVGSQLVTIFQQLVSVPVLLYAWGPDAYGVWITLFSVEMYIQAMANFGFANVAASEIGMRRASGDLESSLRVFQSVFKLTLLISLVVLVAVVPLALGLPLGRWLGLDVIWWAPAGTALAILLAGEPLTLLGVLCCAVYRGEGKMAAGVFYFYVLGRLIESLAFMSAAILGGGLPAAAAAMVLARGVVVGAMLIAARRQVPWIRYGTRHSSWKVVRDFLPAAAAHMAMPASMVMNVAGVNVIVSMMLGPAAVAAVSITRTLGNLSFQAFNMLVQAIWPEISALVGAQQHEKARYVITQTARLCFWIVMLFCLCLLAFAQPFIHIWTSGKIPVVWGLLVLQLLAIVVSCAWRVPSVTLLATNRNARMGVFVLGASGANVLVTAILLPWVGLPAAGVGILVMEVTIIVGILPQALNMIGLSVPTYLKFIMTPPSLVEFLSVLRHPMDAIRNSGGVAK